MEYTVNEFRKNTREALNAAEQGDKVFIVRHKKVFKVVPFGLQANVTELPHKITTSEFIPVNPTATVLKNIDKEYMEKVNERFLRGSCKIHDTPLTPTGKCLQKGCKYA